VKGIGGYGGDREMDFERGYGDAEEIGGWSLKGDLGMRRR
jgi:hypothetical protein